MFPKANIALMVSLALMIAVPAHSIDAANDGITIPNRGTSDSGDSGITTCKQVCFPPEDPESSSQSCFRICPRIKPSHRPSKCKKFCRWDEEQERIVCRLKCLRNRPGCKTTCRWRDKRRQRLVCRERCTRWPGSMRRDYSLDPL